jgi:formyl-CoA transferase
MPNLAPSNAYRCKDGVWLCITATSDRLFARLAAAMGSPDLATRPEFATNAARVQHLGELDASIGKWAAAHNAVDLEERLQEASVPASRILSIADCVEDPHYKDRGAVQAVEDPVLGSVLHPSVFPVFDGEGSSPSIRWCGPKLGEHTVEVLRDFLGLTEGEIDELRAKAVI